MTEEARLQRYETMVVLRTDLAEAGTSDQIERIRKILEANGGVVSAVHEWGIRELAYPIEKETRGYYALAEYTGTTTTVTELERYLKLSDAALRFLSVRQEKDQPAGEPPRLGDTALTSPDLDSEAEDDENGNVDTEPGDLE